MRNIQITASITNRESQATELYFNEIGKADLINADEEFILARKIKQGDMAALNKLIQANLRFVVSVAKKYQHQGLPLGDLISEGNIGLVKAAKRFDETRGFKFISFAVWWIRQSILSALAEHTRMMHLPRNHTNLLTKINNRSAELENQLERQPTDEELAELLEVTPEKIAYARYYSGRTASYDAPFKTGDDYLLIETLSSNDQTIEDILFEASKKQGLDSMLSTLTPRERRVIELSFGLTEDLERSPAEIAPVIALSTERVRQIRNEALKKLRNTKLEI